MKVSVAGTSLNDSEKKSLWIIVREKQQSGRWRKQKLQVQNISSMSQAAEVYISVTTTMKPTKK